MNNNNTTDQIRISYMSQDKSTSPPRTGASLFLSASRLCLGLLRRISHRLLDIALSSRRKLVLGCLLAGRCLPVKNHLQREDGVEGEAGDEAVEDDFVGDFLQGREDAGEGAEEVGEDLFEISVSLCSYASSFVWSGFKGKTYGESRELSSASLTEDSNDLRQLRQSSDSTSTHLQILQQLRSHDIAVKQQESSSSQRSNKHRSHIPLARVLQHQEANRDILDHNERRLAERRERELVAHVVHQRDHQTGGFQQVADEADALGGARVDQLDHLRDFDDGGGGDDGEAERFGDGEFHADRVADCEVVNQAAVAAVAEEHGCELLDWSWEAVGYGREDRAEGLFEGLHGGPINRWVLRVLRGWRIEKWFGRKGRACV